jgi:hypothetical protein
MRTRTLEIAEDFRKEGWTHVRPFSFSPPLVPASQAVRASHRRSRSGSPAKPTMKLHPTIGCGGARCRRWECRLSGLPRGWKTRPGWTPHPAPPRRRSSGRAGCWRHRRCRMGGVRGDRGEHENRTAGYGGTWPQGVDSSVCCRLPPRLPPTEPGRA